MHAVRLYDGCMDLLNHDHPVMVSSITGQTASDARPYINTACLRTMYITVTSISLTFLLHVPA